MVSAILCGVAFGVGCEVSPVAWCQDRAVIMAKLEAGLSQGALPARSAHRLRAEAWHTARAALGCTPPTHSTNSLPPIEHHRMLRASATFCEDGYQIPYCARVAPKE